MADAIWAAMQLSEHPDVCAALESGLPVPRSRLRAEMLERIGEPTIGDDLVLTDEIVLRCEVSLNGSAAEQPDSAPVHSWTPIDLQAADDDPPPPPTIGGLVYPGRRHVVSGEPEALKSWLAAVLCVEEIRAGRPVVYADFEMGRRTMLERLRALGLTDEELGLVVYVTPDEPMTEPAVLADVERMLAVRSPSLAVFDSLTGALALHGCDPNSGVDVERFYRSVVTPIQESGAAFFALDHLPKDRQNRGKFSIGSERKIAATDVHLGVDIVRPFGRGKSGLATIKTHKDRPGYLARPKAAQLELTSDPETGQIVWSITAAKETGVVDGARKPFRPTCLMERVSQYLAACAEPPSRNRVEQDVIGNAAYIRVAMDVLVAEGYVHEIDGARNARLLRFVKLYRESEDELK
jgi:hypothetical protein